MSSLGVLGPGRHQLKTMAHRRCCHGFLDPVTCTDRRFVRTFTSLLAVLVMVGVGAGVRASADAGGYGRCERGGATALQTSPSRTIVLLRNDNYESKDVYLACWRRSGRLRRLGTVRLDGQGKPRSVIGGYAFNGSWVVWGQVATQDGGRDLMRSLNVRTGRHGPVVSVPADARITPTGGPVAVLDESFRNVVAVTASGNYAWLLSGAAMTPEGRYVDAIYVPDGQGSDRLVDRGRVSSVRRFLVRGERLYWKRGGRLHSIRLA